MIANMKRKLSVIDITPRLLLKLFTALLLALALMKTVAGGAGLLFHAAGLPALAEEAAALPEEADPPFREEAILVIAPPRELTPQAVVYCTHTSEEYQGQSRQKGVAGGVLTVARTLAAALEEQGVGVILDESVHDTDYDSAYEHSLASLEAVAAEHPDIRLYIDVHRDSALAGISTTLNAEGESYARMLLIVGSNERLPHPDWQQNYQFAQTLAAATNKLLPGVMREPRLYSGRYNQHIGPQAILVEIGSTDNTVEEAQRSAQVLAQAIAACI